MAIVRTDNNGGSNDKTHSLRNRKLALPEQKYS